MIIKYTASYEYFMRIPKLKNLDNIGITLRLHHPIIVSYFGVVWLPSHQLIRLRNAIEKNKW